MLRAAHVSVLRKLSSFSVCYASENRNQSPDIIRLKPSQMEITELDENGGVIMRFIPLPALTTLYRDRLLQFSVAGWTEVKLAMERIRSDKEGTT